MKELKVKNIIIGKQFESCKNYKEFMEIVKERNIKVHVAEIGEKIKIEENIYFDILWPNPKNVITENSINNNSLVCKLKYKSFSMLFTGDIEKIAEKEILEEYKNDTENLNSKLLKVAHHGSKTSSINEFIEAVKPKVALIGVGKNNKFGHPNDEVIKRLENFRNKNLQNRQNWRNINISR